MGSRAVALLLLGCAAAGSLAERDSLAFTCGAPEALADVYLAAKAGDFQCRDGSGSIKGSKVNDNFCDCLDGSDELGTGACSPVGKFVCKNIGHSPTELPSSRVGDGICDCCDGSDESSPLTPCMGGPCQNTCHVQAEKSAEERQKRLQLVKEAQAIRKSYIEQGKAALAEREERKAILPKELAAMKEGLIPKQEKLELERKKETEERNLHKEQAHSNFKSALGLEKIPREALEALVVKFATHTRETSCEKTLSSMVSFLDEAHSQPGAAHHELLNGLKEEENSILSMALELPADETSIQTVELEAAEEALAKAEEAANNPPDNAEENYENGIPPSIEELKDRVEQEKSARREAFQSQIESHEKSMGAALRVGEWPHEGIYATLHKVAEQEGWQRKLVMLAEEVSGSGPTGAIPPSEVPEPARQEAVDALRAVEAHERKIKELEQEQADTKEIDYGFEQEFYGLKGQCFHFTKTGNSYTLCPFQNAKQDHRNLGNFDRWVDGPWSHNIMSFTNGEGAQCPGHKSRSAEVQVECGKTNAILEVSEPEVCFYSFRFSTPAACSE